MEFYRIPVVRLVNLLLREALELRANEIRIALTEDCVKVVYLIGGEEVERDSPPRRLYSSMVLCACLFSLAAPRTREEVSALAIEARTGDVWKISLSHEAAGSLLDTLASTAQRVDEALASLDEFH